MLHNQMEMFNYYMIYKKRTLWIQLKFVGLKNPQQYLPLFGNHLHFSQTAIKRNKGSPRAAPQGAAPAPAAQPQEAVPPIPAV